MDKEKIHFHTFDAFRFVSFLLVFIHHIPFPKTNITSCFSNSGGIGVSFFFVLSGFLITYILIHEKINTSKINLRNFFIRRVLRIWPLYFVMVLFAFLTPFILDFLHLSYSNIGYKPKWIYSILFIENYRMMLTNSFPNVSPLRIMWSICVEEHFYIVWGIVFYFIPIKKVPYFILICILIANTSRVIYSYYSINTSDLFSNIDYFAYGAIPAYLLVEKNNLLNRLMNFSVFKKQIFMIIVVILVFLLPNLKGVNFVQPTILGVLFLTLILTTITRKKPLKISDKKLINKLGKYTYGLYLYHIIVINLLLQLTKNMEKNYYYWFVFVVTSLILTIIISFLSYHLFEKQFLKLKKKFR